jgi:chloramphenicol 3-O-phosphotransferase
MSDTQLLVITGTMGVGKTATLDEVTDLLADAGVTHACVDLDGLGLFHIVPAPPPDLIFRNLDALFASYLATGVRCFVVAAALERHSDLDRIRRPLGDPSIKVCRLTAPLAIAEARVSQRELGIHRNRYVERTAELDRLLSAARLEDFCIDSSQASVTEVARQLLSMAGWL